MIANIRRAAVAGLAALAVTACRKESPSGEEHEVGTDGPRQASEWFLNQRAFPGKTIPAGARLRAFNDVRSRWPNASRSISRAGGANRAVVGAQWTAVGPAPILDNNTTSGSVNTAGRVASIAIDPTNSQVIYVGAASGGVWKTTDGGATWTPLTDSQCGLATGSIAISPADHNVIFVGTGELNFSLDSYQGCGVLRSADGGATWTALGQSSFVLASGSAATIGKVLVLPGATSVATTTVLVASSFGLYLSTNGGGTWTQILSGTWDDLVLDPASAVTIFAARHGVGVYKSTNSGATFTQFSTGLPSSATYQRIALAAAASVPNTFFASLANATTTSGLVGIYKTTDGGANWAAVGSNSGTTLCSTQCWYNMVISVDPSNANNVFFSGLNLSKSTNGGVNLTTVTTAIHVDHHAFVFDPQNTQTIYAGSDGGIFKSTDGGTTWTTLNTNLNTVQFYPGISVHPTSATTFMGGAQDNGTIEGGAALAWSPVQGGDGAATLYSPSGVAFAEFQAGVTAPVRRDPPSTGTSGWVTKAPSGSATDNAYWVRPLAMDEHNPKVIYFGTTRLARSGDSGDSWTYISSDLVTTPSSQRGIATIALAPSDSQTVYTGSSDGAVYVTSDLGTTWTNITSNLPFRPITKIVVDPLDPKVAWVALSGYSTANPGHVFKTVNRGATWTNISNNLPNVPVNAIAFHRGSRELFIGADVGIYSMVDGGSTWTPVMAGMPNVPVIDIVFDGARGRLVAATHGRGMWTLAVTEAVLRGDVIVNGTVGANDAQAILQFIVGQTPAGGTKFPYGDANCDGNVTALDALLVLTKVAGGSTGTACVGTIK